MNETEIFARVAEERDPEKQTELIRELCGSNQEVRTRIQAMIDAHNAPDSFFETPVSDSEFLSVKQLVSAGATIGPYKLLQEIGEGGMGLVFMAEQLEPVKRRVALKVIKPGMNSREVIARFEAERQALAMMDHPNIAKVFDAGTTDTGLPYFVMELVNGQTITTYCDEESLTTKQRLELFSDVCRAVQHAHQKGIIHRDLKPTNILVAEFDGKPVPKVIDFGVAKATGLQLTEKTLFTEFGQVIGTIEYMSPEQSRRNQLDVDTRSDIYSLGIVLYQLLTGETPFGSERFRQAALDEMIKIIREEEPQLPSIKVRSSASLNQIAQRRNIDPGKLPAQIRGDLDWIVTKSLEKDRNHRYRSAGDFADDITRHLEQRPIEAAPANFFIRFQMFARRNRKAFLAVAAAMTLLMVALYYGQKAANELNLANRRLEEAVQSAQMAMERAQNSAIGDDADWNAADAQIDRVEDSLADGHIKSRDVKQNARDTLDQYKLFKTRRDIANQIEEVVLHGASNSTLPSWQSMEQNMRSLFKENGFDLGSEEPAKIGIRIRDHLLSEQWADLLELWIGTRGHMQGMGGPKLSPEDIKSWAEAMYLADADPIRTGIRKFLYEPPPNKKKLAFADGVDLTKLSARTISWLATCYAVVKEFEKADQIFLDGLELHPRDVMLAHDFALYLFHQQRFQESARIYHRCLVLRDDVPGLWSSLAKVLEQLKEGEAADRARQKAAKLTLDK